MKPTHFLSRVAITLSSPQPVVAQQFGDEAIVEHALVLPVQRDILHQALQERHSCR